MFARVSKIFAVMLCAMPLATLMLSELFPDISVYFRRTSPVVMALCLIGITFALVFGTNISKRLQETQGIDKILFLAILTPAIVVLCQVQFFEQRLNLRGLLTLVVVWYGFMLLAILRKTSARTLYIYALAIPLGMILYGLAIGVMFAFGQFPSDYDWLENGGMPGFLNLRHIGYLLAPSVAMTIGLAAAARRDDTLRRGLLLIAASVLWGLLIWAGSRAGNVAVVGVVLIAVVFLRGLRIRILQASVVALIAGSALSFVYPADHQGLGYSSMIRKVVTAQDTQSLTSGRVVIVKTALTGAIDKPLLGHGIDTFKTVEIAKDAKITHAHNVFANYAYSIGFVGAIALMSWLFISGYRFANVAIETRNGIAVGAFLSLGSVLIFGMLDGVFFHYESIFNIATILAVGYANMTHVSLNAADAKT